MNVMVDTELTQRIQQAFEHAKAKLKKTKKVIGEELDVSQQTLATWTRKGGISRQNIPKLARATGVDYVWLATGHGTIFGQTAHEVLDDQAAANLVPIGSQVPVIRADQAAEFLSGTLDEDLWVGQASLGLVQAPAMGAQAYMICDYPSSEADPVVKKGELVVLDPSQRIPTQDDRLSGWLINGRVTIGIAEEFDGLEIRYPGRPSSPPVAVTSEAYAGAVMLTLKVFS